jgi:hypothetical protein
LRSLQALFAASHSGGSSALGGPLGNRVLSAGTVLIVSALLPVGWWQVWRTHRHQLWIVAMAIVSVGWYVIVAARFTVADGTELAGRAATFIFVPAAFIVALALAHLVGAGVRGLVRVVAVRRVGERLAAILGTTAGGISGRGVRTIGGS